MNDLGMLRVGEHPVVVHFKKTGVGHEESLGAVRGVLRGLEWVRPFSACSAPSAVQWLHVARV